MSAGFLKLILSGAPAGAQSKDLSTVRLGLLMRLVERSFDSLRSLRINTLIESLTRRLRRLEVDGYRLRRPREHLLLLANSLAREATPIRCIVVHKVGGNHFFLDFM